MHLVPFLRRIGRAGKEINEKENRIIERAEDGKKVTEVDERYFRMAEDKLYGEIALAMHMEKSEVLSYIKNIWRSDISY